MNFGIYSLNSGLNSVHNNFDKMRSLSGTSGGDGIFFSANEPSVGSYPKSIVADKNLFGPTVAVPIYHACINLFGSEVQGTISENTMNGQFGVLSNFLGVNEPLDYKQITVLGNAIKYVNGGIILQSNKRIEFIINHNYIYGPAPSTGLQTGLSINTVALTSASAPKFTVSDNSIYEGQIGISILSSTTGSSPTGPNLNSISRNGIYSEHPDRRNFCGIFIQNSNSVEVRCNSINGIASYNSPTGGATPLSINNRGIFLSGSKATWISTNTIDKLNIGLCYTDNCNMPNMLAGNNFKTLNYHIYTTGSTINNKIGDQGLIPPPSYCAGCTTLFAANKMQDITFLPGHFSITNAGPATSAYTYKRRPGPAYIIYDPTAAGSFTLPPLLNIDNVPPYVVSNYAEPATISCAVPTKIPSFTPPSGYYPTLAMFESPPSDMSAIALDLKQSSELLYTEEEEGLKNQDENLLYTLLKTDTSLLENDTLLSFYSEKKDEHLGKLDEIVSLINSKEYELADEKLTELSVLTDVEEINKTVFDLANKMTSRENYYLSEVELNSLLTIANYCPKRYGPSVYSARVLINTQYGYESLFWNDEELCVAGIDYRKNNIWGNTEINAINENTIFPNPASTELNFIVNSKFKTVAMNNFKLYLIDVLGNIVYEQDSDKFISTGKIKITNLANGVYLFKYASNLSDIYKQTFIINK